MIKDFGQATLKAYNIVTYIILRIYVLVLLSIKSKTLIFLFHPSKYHKSKSQLKHQFITQRKNRFHYPNFIIKKLILNSQISGVADQFGLNLNNLIDDGDGWLGIRIIRPGKGDGYTFSKKIWGPGGDCLSFWVPIVSSEAAYTLKFVEGSELRNYQSYLPINSHHHPQEHRLDLSKHKIRVTSHNLFYGQIIVFGPNLIHSEETFKGDKTRISIEFRLKGNI